MKTSHWMQTTALMISAAGLAVLPALGSPSVSVPGAPTPLVWTATFAEDVIVLDNGRTVRGTIIEETDDYVKIKVVIAGISAVSTYDRDSIASITRGAESGESETAQQITSSATISSLSGAKRAKPAASDDGMVRIYIIPLKGVFGTDISETPIRQSLSDAHSRGAEIIIFELENEWSDAIAGGLGEVELPDDFDPQIGIQELMRAEQLESILTKEIPKQWDEDPKVVFWVRNAMGGSAFLPFITPDIYFHSEGRMGGIGGIAQLFEGVGDVVVREKQRSLRVGHAHGMAIQGGHDTRIIDAMLRMDYVLSYEMVGGEPVFYERMPIGSHETLLTDNGMLAEFSDSMPDQVRGLGNDVLTLKSETARDLGVSKGTVDTLDDLLFELEVHRNSVVIDGRADDIMKQWRNGVHDYPTKLRRMWNDYEQIQVQGDYNERKKARGAQIAKLRQFKQIAKKFIEAMDPRQYGYPGIADVNMIIEIIKLEQLADQK